VVFFDFDNDTQLDLAVANGHIMDNAPQYCAGATYAQRNQLFRNVSRGRFAEVSRDAGAGFAVEKVSRGLVSGHRQRRRPGSARDEQWRVGGPSPQ
jgi:enediyne biosynthesis protein E4